MSDWWSKRLTEGPGAPQPRDSSPPITPPFNGAIRIPTPASTHSPTPTHQQTMDPSGQTDMGTALRLWKGGEAHRREQGSCPECGSNLMFSRSKTTINGHPPAPHCYECGYNGRFAQADQSSWVS